MKTQERLELFERLDKIINIEDAEERMVELRGLRNELDDDVKGKISESYLKEMNHGNIWGRKL